MAKYIVRCSVDYWIDVEAENEDEAIDKAEKIPRKNWGGKEVSAFDVEED
jgi:hypothetical protein